MRYIFKYIYTRIKNALIYLIILWLAIVVLFQKKKIEEFYNFFINNKQKFNLESLMSDTKMGCSVSTKNLWDSHGKSLCKDFLLYSRLVKDRWINEEWITKYIDHQNLDVRYVNKFFGLLAFEIWYRIFITNEMNPHSKLK